MTRMRVMLDMEHWLVSSKMNSDWSIRCRNILILFTTIIIVGSVIILYGHAYRLSAFGLFKYSVFFKLILTVGTVLLPLINPDSKTIGIPWLFCSLFISVDTGDMILRSSQNDSPLCSSWLSIFIIDWGSLHCSSFEVTDQSAAINSDVNDQALLVDNVRNDHLSIMHYCLGFSDWVRQRRASLMSIVVIVYLLVTLIEITVLTDTDDYFGLLLVLVSWFLLFQHGIRSATAVWTWMPRLLLLMDTLFLMAKYRNHLHSSVNLVLLQSLSVIDSAWLTVTLTQICEAANRWNNLVSKMSYNSLILIKNVTIFCVCVQWLIAQCSLFLFLIPFSEISFLVRSQNHIGGLVNDAVSVTYCRSFLNWLHQRRTSLIILVITVFSLGLLMETVEQKDSNFSIGMIMLIGLLMTIPCFGTKDRIQVWPWLHRFIFFILTLSLFGEFRMTLHSKLTIGSTSVKFVFWQFLAIITALLLSWLTFTLNARSKATLRSNNLFSELINSSWIRNKNVLITCVCVQWLLAQCSLFLLLLPLDIYSANAHRSWLKNQYGRTIFYTQLFSLIGAKQLNLSFVEFSDDSHDDHSGRPSLSNALSTMFKSMIFCFALFPVSIFVALSGVINHPFNQLLWINLSLPLLKFVNVLILKWLLRWHPMTNEQPMVVPIRVPRGFPFQIEPLPVCSWIPGWIVGCAVFDLFLLWWAMVAVN